MNITRIEKMIHEYLNSVKEAKQPSILSSATLDKITAITNQYFADNNIYIKHPYPIMSKEYYLPPRGNNNSSISKLLYFNLLYKSYIDSLTLNRFKYFTCTFSPEYKYSNLKMEIKNYYLHINYTTITEKVITQICNLHLQNSNSIQRNNKYKDSNMKALEIITNSNLNNKSKKFHK